MFIIKPSIATALLVFSATAGAIQLPHNGLHAALPSASQAGNIKDFCSNFAEVGVYDLNKRYAGMSRWSLRKSQQGKTEWKNRAEEYLRKYVYGMSLPRTTRGEKMEIKHIRHMLYRRCMGNYGYNVKQCKPHGVEGLPPGEYRNCKN